MWPATGNSRPESHCRLSAHIDGMSENTASDVREFLSGFGLPGIQLSRLMGVTERKVRHWMDGTAMTAAQADRFQEIVRAATELDATTPRSPAERYSLLFSSRDGKASLFTELLGAAPHSQRIHHPVPVAERFGAEPLEMPEPSGSAAARLVPILARANFNTGSYGETWAAPVRQDAEALIADALEHLARIIETLEEGDRSASALRDRGASVMDRVLDPAVGTITVTHRVEVLTDQERSEIFHRSLRSPVSPGESEVHDDVAELVKICSSLRDDLTSLQARATGLATRLTGPRE